MTGQERRKMSVFTVCYTPPATSKARSGSPQSRATAFLLVWSALLSLGFDFGERPASFLTGREDTAPNLAINDLDQIGLTWNSELHPDPWGGFAAIYHRDGLTLQHLGDSAVQNTSNPQNRHNVVAANGDAFLWLGLTSAADQDDIRFRDYNVSSVSQAFRSEHRMADLDACFTANQNLVVVFAAYPMSAAHADPNDPDHPGNRWGVYFVRLQHDSGSDSYLRLDAEPVRVDEEQLGSPDQDIPSQARHPAVACRADGFVVAMEQNDPDNYTFVPPYAYVTTGTSWFAAIPSTATIPAPAPRIRPRQSARCWSKAPR